MKTAIILALIAVCHLSQGNKLVSQNEKPGQCPNVDGAFGVCGAKPKEICVGDQDCQGGLKCCNTPCGQKTCTNAIQVSPPLPPRENPGQCPPQSGSRGICTFDPKNNCLGDQDCNPNQKCCADQCGKTCKSSIQVSPPQPIAPRPPPPPPANLERPGQCPAPSGSVGICTFDPKNNCLRDNECAPNQKCCADRCGKTCKYSQQISPPRPQRPPPPPPPRKSQDGKPGRCPASGDSFKACVFDPTKNCLHDRECPNSLKCCSDGCGRVCKRPE